MSQAFGVRDTCEILRLTRDRFIAHQIYVEGIAGNTLAEKEAAADAKWHRDKRHVDILGRGSGPDTQLGVAGLPRTEGFRAREPRRHMTCSDSIHTKTECEDGITSRALTGEPMGDFGSVFAQGCI